MYKQETIVKCNSGLYNDQVTLFVQKANEYNCSIYLEAGNKQMNAKSLLGIMFMCIDTGTAVTISADGPDEKEAVAALCELLQRDLF